MYSYDFHITNKGHFPNKGRMREELESSADHKGHNFLTK